MRYTKLESAKINRTFIVIIDHDKANKQTYPSSHMAYPHHAIATLSCPLSSSRTIPSVFYASNEHQKAVYENEQKQKIKREKESYTRSQGTSKPIHMHIMCL